MTCADCTHCPWTRRWREVVSWGMHCLQKQRRQRVPLKPPETLLSNTWTPACETCQDSWPTELQHNTIYPVHETNGRDEDLSWAVVPENPPFHLPTPLSLLKSSCLVPAKTCPPTLCPVQAFCASARGAYTATGKRLCTQAWTGSESSG